MTGVVVLLVLSATLIVALMALMLAERDMKSIIGDQQYALLSAAAAQIDAQISARQMLLASLADNVPMEAGSDPAAMQAFVAHHHAARKEFLNLHIFSKQGALLHTDGDHAIAALTLNPRNRAYLENALAAGKPVVSPPFRSAHTDRPSIMLLQPVHDKQGQTVMLLGGSIDLNSTEFLADVAERKPGKTGYIFIMTMDGILLQHPDTSRLMEHINAKPGYNRATDMALHGFQGWTEAANKEGSEGIYSYKHLESTGWIIGARYPVDEAFAPMIAMRWHALLAATGFAAVAGLLAWLVIQRLLQPLGQLRRNISEIRSGDADISVLQRGRGDEIGDLSVAFHELISEREAAQTAILESQSLISNILERAPDAFVAVTGDGIITMWNVTAERTFGWTREEAMGRDVADLIVPESYRDAHHTGMTYFALGGSGPMINKRVRVSALHKDGHTIPIEISIGGLKHQGTWHATAFLHDISARLRSEQLIAASEKRLRMVADSMPALIAYIDRDLRYQFTNEHYRTMMGADPRKMLGRSIVQVFGQEFADNIAPFFTAALNGQRVHYEREGVQQGRRMQMMGDMIPDIASDGTVAGFYLMVQDITERKTAELRQAASETRLKLLTDNLPVLISYLDRDRRLQFLNATFQQWTGIDAQRLIGRHLMDAIGGDHYYTAEPHLDRAYRGEIVTYEVQATLGNSVRTLEITFVPELAADGSVAGIYSLTHDTTRMKEIEERLKQLARIDTLTGIPNRLMFEELLQQAILRARRNHKPLALAYLDIDYFKEINDSMGHAAGDLVLKEFSSRLIASVRAIDTVARLAGDEFVIVFEQVTGKEEAARLAAKIVEAMRRPFEMDGAPRQVTTSVGVALHQGGDEPAEALLARADSALYAAKRHGRDGFVLGD